MNTPWTRPVVVSLGEPATETVVDTTQAAAWSLIEDWPLDDGVALDRALLVCAAVDAGKRKPEEARQAFVEAAREAGILLRS